MVGETWETWREPCAKTIEIGPDSVTIYQMELPYNTVYSQELLGGGSSVPLADWPTKRAWQDYAFERLAAAGYVLSSAYTMVRPDPGKRSGASRFVYRDSVWHGCDMLGAGVASFSHLSGVHFQNVGELGRLPGVARRGPPAARPRLRHQRARAADCARSILQLKLGRLEAGAVPRPSSEPTSWRSLAPAWRRLEAEGMLAVGADAVELTREGLLQVDRLLPELYDERYRNARYT